MTYIESDLLPISSLTHLSYCKRRFALIHIEQQWAENVFTAEGHTLHDRVHELESENRPGVRIVRGLRLVSYALGLVGQADVVEFRQNKAGITLPEASGLWQPIPVEYKRGKPKKDNSDKIQLCAQAMCLEEMLNISIPHGTLFYGKIKRRTQVELTSSLRQETKDCVRQIRNILERKVTPRIEYSKKCNNCSLYDICLPQTTGKDKRVDNYLSKAGCDQGIIE
jgi:CRISPR-associated exonuclease Cas4